MIGNFYRDVICKDQRFNSPQACHDLGLLEPVTRAAVVAIIADAAKMGHVLVPVETYRSQARQLYFYQKGLTKLRNVGCHGFGLACDLALVSGGKYDSVGTHYLFLRHLAEEHGLISGADWGRPDQEHSFRDFDHIQRCAMHRQSNLFASRWYPDESYSALNDMGRTVATALNAPLTVPYQVAFAAPDQKPLVVAQGATGEPKSGRS